MDFKEKARSLQILAKEFGYEIKLTHAQEILARMDGFKSRHPALKKGSQSPPIAVENTFRYFTLMQKHGGNGVVRDNEIIFFSNKAGSSSLSSEQILILSEKEGIDAFYLQGFDGQELTEEAFVAKSLMRVITLSEFIKRVKEVKENILKAQGKYVYHYSYITCEVGSEHVRKMHFFKSSSSVSESSFRNLPKMFVEIDTNTHKIVYDSLKLIEEGYYNEEVLKKDK